VQNRQTLYQARRFCGGDLRGPSLLLYICRPCRAIFLRLCLCARISALSRASVPNLRGMHTRWGELNKKIIKRHNETIQRMHENLVAWLSFKRCSDRLRWLKA
jgi:hypothetical protein